MSRSPLQVKGLRNLLDQVGDEVAQATRRGYVASGRVELEGRFTVDQEGELRFGGDLRAVGPVEGVPVEASVGGGVTRRIEAAGAGTLRVVFEVRTEAGGSR